jgi:hypothetical protein
MARPKVTEEMLCVLCVGWHITIISTSGGPKPAQTTAGVHLTQHYRVVERYADMGRDRAVGSAHDMCFAC